MSVLIKINTGFVGAEHLHDTEIPVEEWDCLSSGDQNDIIVESILQYVDGTAIDSETEEEV
jgi:uncharacterized protein YuzB (UPF0349 family)